MGNNQFTKAKREKRTIIVSEETRQKLSKASKGRYHTEQIKQIISLKRKNWLLNHKDEHVWKRKTKFVSIPCENFKRMLNENNISFVEEFEPFNDVNYCVDIAFPDEKIAIEINGNQHYNKDGTLKEYYQNRHNLFEERGWKIFEIHYSKCYNIDIKNFEDILKLPIYDKDYVGKYFSKKDLKIKLKEESVKEKLMLKQQEENKRKQIIENLINNSGIDFSKSHWSSNACTYLENRGELWNKGIFRCIRKYCPDFLKRDDVWKRSGSKI